MSSEAQQEQIIQKLKIIDQFNFESMVNNLIYQGAFPEIADEGALVEQFGINVEKERTIKSSPRADSEIRSSGLKVESSVDDWSSKLQKLLDKYKESNIKFFAFFTNQDTGTKLIRINGISTDAQEYCVSKLRCKKAWIIGQKELVLLMQDPKFFSIRRNYLNIQADFFCSATEYSEILKQPTLKSEVEESALQRYGIILKDRVSFDHSRILLLHNNEYITLLHTIRVWALNLYEKEPQDFDFCFIRWPYTNTNIASVDDNEVDENIPTFLIVWGAHEIGNLSDFLRFASDNVTIVLVTLTGFREVVHSKLESLGINIRVEEVSVETIDERPVRPEEKAKHEEKIKTVVKELLDLMLRFEALVYFYSPFSLDDQQKTTQVMAILQIDETKLYQLRELLIKADLAAITGRILWLKQPVVAKELLSDFISNDTFLVTSLVE